MCKERYVFLFDKQTNVKISYFYLNMKSVTKFEISKEQIKSIFIAAEIGEIVDIQEISDGWYNSVFSVTAKSTQKYVLKVAPAKNVKILSHEHRMMESELIFYKLISEKTKVQTAKIIYEDFSEKIIPTAYFIMEFLQGERLDKAKLAKEEGRKANENWAFILSEFHKIKGEGFGYVQSGLHRTWKDALTKMTQMLIDDSASFGKKCKIGEKLLAYIGKFSAELDNVPCSFVNFDLHSKNLFCTKEANGDIKLAVLDLERCFFGDPIGDFIMPEMLTPFEKKNFLSTYNRFAEMSVSANKNQKIRYYLICAYLAAIMYTERFSRFISPQKYFSGIYWEGTLGCKLLARNAFANLKKLSK